jgi:hypothetical protein
MLFLIINSTIGKYYPNFFTQFLIGCVIYIFVLFIATEFIPDKLYEKYKYHGLVLLIIDFAYLIYKTKYANEATIISDDDKKKEKNSKITLTTEEKSTTNVVSPSDSTIKQGTTSSNTINGLSMSESDNDNIFSASSITETENNNSSESVTFGTSN